MAIVVGFAIPPLFNNPAWYSSPANTVPLQQSIVASVSQLAGNPAVLAWVVGNEFEFGCTAATPGWADMWRFVQSVTAAIRAADPSAHPVGVGIKYNSISAAVPAVAAATGASLPDFLGVNTGGAAQAAGLSAALSAAGWSKPSLATEYGMWTRCYEVFFKNSDFTPFFLCSRAILPPLAVLWRSEATFSS